MSHVARWTSAQRGRLPRPPRPSRVGNAPRFLKDEIRQLACGLARSNFPADFVVAAIQGLSAGWAAFSGYAHSAACAAAGRPLAPAGHVDSSRPVPSAPPLCNARSRRSSRRRLAREAAAKEQDASAQKIRDAEAAAHAAQQTRDAEAAAAQQIRDAEAAAQAAQQIRDAEAAAAQQIRDAEAAAQTAQLARDAEAAKQAAKQSAVPAQDTRREVSDAVAQAARRREVGEDTETGAQAAQRRQDAVDRFRQEVAAVSWGTTRRWQWARVDGRLSRTDAQRRQDAADCIRQGVPTFVSPTSGIRRLQWGRFDGRSPGRQLSVRSDGGRSLAAMRNRTPVVAVDAEL